MRRLLYLLTLVGCGCSSTPDTAPEVDSVYDAEGNLKQNLSSTRSWEEQQALMNDMKDSLKKQPPADASGPIQEIPKKK